METATQNLENDHVYILKLIDVMEKVSLEAEPEASLFETIVHIIRNFADGLHHAKEEKLLFPLMAQKGFSNEQGPIAVMLSDHDEGRAYVKGMSDHIESYRQGNKLALQQIISNMKGYCTLLRDHIAKENNVLFRMADNAISSDEQKMLLSQFTCIDKGQSGNESSIEFISRIETLTKKFLK